MISSNVKSRILKKKKLFLQRKRKKKNRTLERKYQENNKNYFKYMSIFNNKEYDIENMYNNYGELISDIYDTNIQPIKYNGFNKDVIGYNTIYINTNYYIHLYNIYINSVRDNLYFISHMNHYTFLNFIWNQVIYKLFQKYKLPNEIRIIIRNYISKINITGNYDKKINIIDNYILNHHFYNYEQDWCTEEWYKTKLLFSEEKAIKEIKKSVSYKSKNLEFYYNII